MKALLVGDNSCFLNWGGRGGSLALKQMLSEEFEISGVIPGNAFLLKEAGFGFVNTIMPPRHHSLLLHFYANRHRRKIFDYYLRLEELFGAKDFVAHDPSETVENILRYKGKVREIGELYNKANEAELVIVHGEGDMVFSSPPRRPALFLLGMAELGLRLKKRVVFANALVSDCPTTGRNTFTFEYARRTLSRCHGVFVRDRQSLDFVKMEMGIDDCTLVPDSLFTWYPIVQKACGALPANGDFIIPFPEKESNLGKLNFSKPYICIGGSASAGRSYEKSIKDFSSLVAKFKELGYAVYLTENCVGDLFLQSVATNEQVGLVPVNTAIFMGSAILANARLFISGRYHPSILASLGGTPCVFLGSNAHKMHSLQKLLEYDYIREFPLHLFNEETDELIDVAKEYLNRGESLRKKIKAVAGKRCSEAKRLPEAILDRVGNTGPLSA